MARRINHRVLKLGSKPEIVLQNQVIVKINISISIEIPVSIRTWSAERILQNQIVIKINVAIEIEIAEPRLENCFKNICCVLLVYQSVAVDVLCSRGVALQIYVGLINVVIVI